MASASKQAMERLHAALADEMANILKDGRKEVTKDGTVVQVNPSPADLNAIRQFLKDNGIEAQAGSGKGAKSFDELKSKALPFLTREDDESRVAEH